MNAAETIQAAIDKLEELRDQATPGTWRLMESGYSGYGGVDSIGSTNGIVINPDDERGGAVFQPEDGDLIVTLHRTIDAQLGVLRTALASGISEMVVTSPEMFKGYGAAAYRTAHDLARAIVGEVTD